MCNARRRNRGFRHGGGTGLDRLRRLLGVSAAKKQNQYKGGNSQKYQDQYRDPGKFLLFHVFSGHGVKSSLLNIFGEGVQQVVDGMDGLSTLGVDAGDTAADAADKFIIKASGGLGDLFHGDHLIAYTVIVNSNGIFVCRKGE